MSVWAILAAAGRGDRLGLDRPKAFAPLNDRPLIAESLDREGLVTAQTPQAFVASVLRDALTGEVSDAADCASLVEARGGRVRIVEGDSHLLKVTDPADLELVASWL